MAESTPTPESQEPVAPAAPEPTSVPLSSPVPMPVTVVRTPLRERFRGSTPALAVFGVGTLFGALLSLGIAELAEDGHRGPGMEEVRGGPGMPGYGPGMHGDGSGMRDYGR